MRLGERDVRAGGGAAGGPGRPRNEGFDVGGVKLSFLSGGAIAVGGFVLFCLLWGLHGVEVNEYALNSSLLTKKVGQKSYASGRYWIGPMNSFIKFPAVVKTIQFSDSKMQSDLGSDEAGEPMLRSRTRDGLDVQIELSFQYQLNRDQLFDLYTTLGAGRDFHVTFVRIAIDRLTEVATEFTANEFFIDRTKIGKYMEKKLKGDFEARLFSTIFSFQLRSVSLPKEFENAIQMTEVKKQDIEVAGAEQDTTRVSMETLLMQAKRRAKVVMNQADAFAQSVMLENTADIRQYNETQVKATESYEAVSKQLDDKESDLLAYVQSRVVRDHPGNKMTVGMTLPTFDVNSV